ncbi:MAG: calcium-translocating P-type ATPase, PMCA-type [Tannerellaceae bacterium]|jgi:Ca2+-transporting ATPase|nr:calcium-translocating P-type ATPase, PMCA-type [Tannerellaceae bacterium]
MHTELRFTGLTDAQVQQNRLTFGANTLTPPPKSPWYRALFDKFTDPLIIILLVALALSIAVAAYEFLAHNANPSVFLEPLGILAAILLATVVGFLFELSANKKFDVLNQVNDDTPVTAIRNAFISQVPKRDIVVGDIVILETGEEVPADGSLLDAVSLLINESTLTGEPSARKSADPNDNDPDATYPSNTALKGTTVLDGHATLRVSAVGDHTEFGKVYQGTRIDDSVTTPLNAQLTRLANLISKAAYAVAALVFLARSASFFLNPDPALHADFALAASYFLNTLMIAVTLIVVAVPEGLPMAVTLSLALSMKRMLANNNLVRKLHACETMGAATVICTDKTGTLTQNLMSVAHTHFFPPNDLPNLVHEAIASNSTAFLDLSDPTHPKPLGNPTEAALLLYLHSIGVNFLPLRDTNPPIDQLTFSTERKFMATLIHSSYSHQPTLHLKGAPEIILSLCNHIPHSLDHINQLLASYQNQAMRTIAFAYQTLPPDCNPINHSSHSLEHPDLTFLGFAAIADPIRPTVPHAIQSCSNAGIDVKIVTGDTPNTAIQIAKQIGLWTSNTPTSAILTGDQFADTPDEQLLPHLNDLKIIARARPLDKQRLVRLLQSLHHVVAVTGDGTNDAPALSAAHVGLSMGDGTSVAKEASDITILDNSFDSISAAVLWGRSLYQNIQRFILFQLTINVAACLIVLIGSATSTQSPLTVTQMLWVNLIMDSFAALALASLPPNPAVMNLPPRTPNAPIIPKHMLSAILASGAIFTIALSAFLLFLKSFDLTPDSPLPLPSNTSTLSLYELSLFFTAFVLIQFWNLFNAKAFMTHRSAFHSIFNAPTFLATASLILIGQFLITAFGSTLFNTTPLSSSHWLALFALTSPTLILPELFRLFKH